MLGKAEVIVTNVYLSSRNYTTLCAAPSEEWVNHFTGLLKGIELQSMRHLTVEEKAERHGKLTDFCRENELSAFANMLDEEQFRFIFERGMARRLMSDENYTKALALAQRGLLLTK